MNKNQQRKNETQRRVVCKLLCLALVGAAVWFTVASIKESNQHRSTMAKLQTVLEEKGVLQCEVEWLQGEVDWLGSVVSNGVFFQEDTPWVADEVPYYDIPLSLDLQLYTYTKCAELGISDYCELVLAMMWQESNYETDLISITDDYGIMQINICNHDWLYEELGITDLLDPYQSIDAGARIIASLLLKYEDPHKALMSYNYGESGARRVWNGGTYTSAYSRAIVEKQEILLSQLRLD